MLTTDLPDGAWQRQALPGVITDLTVTDPPLAAFIQLVQPTPEQLDQVIATSDANWNGLNDPHSPASARDMQADSRRALTMTFREFYQHVGGEALVAAHAPEVLPQASEVTPTTIAPETGAQTPQRGPGRPRLDNAPDPEPRIVGEVTVQRILDGHDARILELRADPIADRLRADMAAFVDRLVERTDFFDSLQLGDTLVRTWSANELAELLGVDAITLRNWRDRGIGPKFIATGTRGNAFRYPVFRVVEWLIDGSERAS